MQIDENLALAARRGLARTLRAGITSKEREEYRELLKPLNLGLEERLTVKVGLLSGEEKAKLTVKDLLEKFEQVSGGEFANDPMMLS